MKKILSSALALAIICSVLMLFTGCHGLRLASDFEIPEEFDTSKNYEITFWAKNDTNKTQVRIYRKAVSDFEALYPNIKVNIRLYTDYGKINNDVITNISTGTTPNVCITYPDHIATYISGANTVVPLDELLTDARYGLGGSKVRFSSPSKDEIAQKYLSECYLGESCYALPFMRSTEACYINKTYVEKLGYTIPEKLTWDFIWEVSDAATEKNEDGTYKVNGQNVMIPFVYKSTDNMMIQMLRQKGAGYATEEGETLIFNDTTKALLYTIAGHVENGAFSTFSISGYPGNYLNAGQCIFAIDSTAGATWMGSDAPLMDISDDKVVDFETVVMPVPQFDTEHPQMISQGPSVCIFNKSDPQEVLASWLFVQYLLTDDIQTAYAKTEGYVPVTLTAQSSAEYKDYLSRAGQDNDEYYDVKIKASQLLLDNIESTFVAPAYNGSTSLRNAAGQLIENVTKSIRRGETVDEEYMQNLYKEVGALYRLDQTGMTTGGEKPLGKMPAASVVLICVIAAIWFCLAIFYIFGAISKRKKER